MIVWEEGQITQPINFPTRAAVDNDQLVLAMAADLDLSPEGTVTVDGWSNLPASGYDMLMHVGDFAYDIQDLNGTLGDQFFEKMSASSARIPYMVAAGNHEDFMDGYMFDYRFRMPNTQVVPSTNPKSQQNNYFDFVFKGVYFVTMNFDYLLFYNPTGMAQAVAWLEDSMITASNNPNVQWKVFFTHRPIYCNDIQFAADCSVNMYLFKAIEDLLIKYGVQVVLNGHVHIYSRFYPFSNLTFDNSNTSTVTGIGQGSYFQVIGGHSGTDHFFPGQGLVPQYELPFVANVNLLGSSYCLFNFSGSQLQFSLIDSASGSTLDSLTLTVPGKNSKPNSPNHSTLIIILSAGVFVVLSLMVYLMTRFGIAAKILERRTTENSKPPGVFQPGQENAKQVVRCLTARRKSSTVSSMRKTTKTCSTH